VRRTAWLVLSPWLAVALASAVAWPTTNILRDLLTIEGGGLENLAGEVFALLAGALVWSGGSAALLRMVARRTFPAPAARTALGWAVVAAVMAAVFTGAATFPLEGGGLPLALAFTPVFLPAAGTGAFLVTERRLTGRSVPRRAGRHGAALIATLALAGALVGATVGVVVDVVAFRPSAQELGAAARGLVPLGYAAEEPVPVNGTVLLTAYPGTPAPDTAEVEATVAAAGWRTDDVERSPGSTTLVLSRGDVAGTVVMSENSLGPPYSVTVFRQPVDGRGALVGGLLGAAAGAVGALVRRRV
jgi:hypothetical protein